MSTLYGRASIDGCSYAVSHGGASINMSQSGASGSHSYDEVMLHDGNGEVIGSRTSRERIEFSIDYTPIAASGTNTTSNAATALRSISPNAVVTLSGFTTATGYWDPNGAYNYTGGMSVSYDPDGYAKCTIPLRKYIFASSTPSLLSVTISS
jgi:hypothetical protein